MAVLVDDADPALLAIAMASALSVTVSIAALHDRNVRHDLARGCVVFRRRVMDSE